MVKHEYRGQEFYFNETPQIPSLVQEIFNGNYKIFASKIEFYPGDIILDIGANEGVFSLMMAKCFPVWVEAYEPVQRTFFQMIRNIGLNSGAGHIQTFNVGVGKERGQMTFAIGQEGWSGGSSGKMTFDPKLHDRVQVDLIKLDDIIGDRKIKLLKMDIEGMEYDALYACTKLSQVEFFCGEFHMNSRLNQEGRRMDGLSVWVGRQTKLIAIEACIMSE